MGGLNGKTDSIRKSHQIMVVNMLQKLSLMYSSHHKIIKRVDFKPIHCAINLDVVPSSRVFSEFDFVFLSNLNQ